MKYISTDRLCDFEFHDSEWSVVSWENGNLTVKLRALNIHKDAGHAFIAERLCEFIASL